MTDIEEAITEADMAIHSLYQAGRLAAERAEMLRDLSDALLADVAKMKAERDAWKERAERARAYVRVSACIGVEPCDLCQWNGVELCHVQRALSDDPPDAK